MKNKTTTKKKTKKLSKLELKNQKAKERIKKEDNEEIKENDEDDYKENLKSLSINSKYSSFSDYLKRSEEQRKHKDKIEELSFIGQGYYTMYELVHFSKNTKIYILPEIEKLNSFNKKNHKHYNSWKEASQDFKFTEKQLIEYKEYISFYFWCTSNKNQIEKLSEKTKKILENKLKIIDFCS